MKTSYRVIAPFLTDPKVKILMGVFSDAGHADDYRFAGGAIRNVLMNIDIADVDIATILTPDRVKEIFEDAGFNVHPTGLEHGTVTISIKGEPFEITTCRRDVLTDGRRAEIEYTTDWAEDAMRRDFRCNALMMDHLGHIYDYVGGGIEDAQNRKLVFVGEAAERIQEDYLRILRLYRFMSTLGATTDWSAAEACRIHQDGLGIISGERIEKEMMKLLGGQGAIPALKAMVAANIYDTIFGELVPKMNMIERLFSVTGDPVLRLAGLIEFNIGMANQIFHRWKSANDMKTRVRNTCKGSIYHREEDREEIVQEALLYGIKAVRDRMAISWARDDRFGRARTSTSYGEVMALADDIEKTLPVFPLRGQDIIDIGVPAGKEVGVLLKAAQDWWKVSGFPDRDAAIEWVRSNRS